MLTPDELPPDPAELDADAVKEILGNLLDNARRYATQRIEVSIERTDPGVTIRLTDDGPGLASGWAERTFERFVTVGERGGSGLGLAIARELARAHGGNLSYESGGFVLRLDVPRRQETHPGAGGGPPRPPVEA